jgi:hypothetical protein
MKTNELRLGNLVMYNNQIVKTTGLHYGMFECGSPNNNNWMCTGRISEVHPIELTEELLLKIGFKKEERMSSILYYLDYEINEDECIRVRYVIYNSKTLPLLRITSPTPIILESCELTKRGIIYLHELQNIYYCLTEQELEVNL